ncbi:MAG: Glycosyl transferase family 2 [Microgenomates group bacterium GW2011_GWC1_43_13]|nr:MAG: Glycosyl transferase family 2 [Microgenomates group bacterium GW2011_GWC1_43_13]
MKIFLVIPLFNEEKHIVKVLKGVLPYKLPVIVVDDGSLDSSSLKAQNLKLKNTTILQHTINLGKGAAMKTGADYAFAHGADAVIFMDSDAQHNPEDLPKFIRSLDEKKCGVVFGSRNLHFGVPLVRYLGNKFASALVALFFGIYVSDTLCGYRAVTKNAYGKLKWESTGYGVETEMVIRTGKAKLKFCEVPVETIYHSGVKGVTPLDAFGILAQVVKWKLTL